MFKIYTSIDCLLNEEWRLCESLIEVLQPFEWATRKLSGDCYSTLSMVIPLISHILVKLRGLKCKHSIGETIRKGLIGSVEARLVFS